MACFFAIIVLRADACPLSRYRASGVEGFGMSSGGGIT